MSTFLRQTAREFVVASEVGHAATARASSVPSAFGGYPSLFLPTLNDRILASPLSPLLPRLLRYRYAAILFRGHSAARPRLLTSASFEAI